jgi:hypothetical protein
MRKIACMLLALVLLGTLCGCNSGPKGTYRTTEPLSTNRFRQNK